MKQNERIRLLGILSRLSDRSTVAGAAQDLEDFIHGLDSSSLPGAVTLLGQDVPEPKAFARKELVAGIAKLVARDSPVRDASLQGPILSRLISSLRSKAKDTDTTVRDACVAAFAALGRAMDETDHPLGTGTVSNPVIKALMELVAEHSREAQYVGCGALGHVVESTGGLEHGLIKTLIRHLGSTTFLAKAALISTFGRMEWPDWDHSVHHAPRSRPGSPRKIVSESGMPRPAGLVITSGGILVPAIPVILGHPTDPDAAPATPRGAQRARPPGLLSMMTDAPEWQTRRAAAEACQALVIALGPAVDASVGSSVPLDDPSRPSSRVMAAARAARFDRVRDVRQAGALAALAVARLHEHMSGSAAGMQWPAFIQECLPRDYRESRGPGGSPGQSPGRGISPGNTRRPKQLNEAFLAAQQRGEEIRAPFLDKLRESLQGLDAHLDDGEGQDAGREETAIGDADLSLSETAGQRGGEWGDGGREEGREKGDVEGDANWGAEAGAAADRDERGEGGGSGEAGEEGRGLGEWVGGGQGETGWTGGARDSDAGGARGVEGEAEGVDERGGGDEMFSMGPVGNALVEAWGSQVGGRGASGGRGLGSVVEERLGQLAEQQARMLQLLDFFTESTNASIEALTRRVGQVEAAVAEVRDAMDVLQTHARPRGDVVGTGAPGGPQRSGTGVGRNSRGAAGMAMRGRDGTRGGDALGGAAPSRDALERLKGAVGDFLVGRGGREAGRRLSDALQSTRPCLDALPAREATNVVRAVVHALAASRDGGDRAGPLRWLEHLRDLARAGHPSAEGVPLDVRYHAVTALGPAGGPARALLADLSVMWGIPVSVGGSMSASVALAASLGAEGGASGSVSLGGGQGEEALGHWSGTESGWREGVRDGGGREGEGRGVGEERAGAWGGGEGRARNRRMWSAVSSGEATREVVAGGRGAGRIGVARSAAWGEGERGGGVGFGLHASAGMNGVRYGGGDGGAVAPAGEELEGEWGREDGKEEMMQGALGGEEDRGEEWGVQAPLPTYVGSSHAFAPDSAPFPKLGASMRPVAASMPAGVAAGVIRSPSDGAGIGSVSRQPSRRAAAMGAEEWYGVAADGHGDPDRTPEGEFDGERDEARRREHPSRSPSLSLRHEEGEHPESGVGGGVVSDLSIGPQSHALRASGRPPSGPLAEGAVGGSVSSRSLRQLAKAMSQGSTRHDGTGRAGGVGAERDSGKMTPTDSMRGSQSVSRRESYADEGAPKAPSVRGSQSVSRRESAAD